MGNLDTQNIWVATNTCKQWNYLLRENYAGRIVSDSDTFKGGNHT